jgi:hypothetical protein
MRVLTAVPPRAPRLLGSVALLLGGFALALGAPGGRAANLELDVTFNANHTISVTLPDGTPVGTTSGAPTVIPAGFYNIDLNDSAVVSGPQFDLQGPGVSVVDNMFFGESPSSVDTADLLPDSTYTWRDDENPAVVFTFTTSATVASSTPVSASSSSAPSAGRSSSETGSPGGSKDIVGSAVVVFRGALTATVTASGKLELAFKNKPVSTLKSGRYTITVSDESAKSGFTLQEINRSAVEVSGAAFVGRRSLTLEMAPGQWFFYPTFVGKKTYFVVVS